MIICTKCDKPQSVDQFYLDRSQRYGHRPSCITCDRKAAGRTFGRTPLVTSDDWQAAGEWTGWPEDVFIERYIAALKNGTKVSPAAYNRASRLMKQQKERISG